MPDIRESIDEMIEESYLLGLSKSEIKADLDRFVEICGHVIYENVRDRRQVQHLTDKLARARALSLIEDNQEDEPGPPVSPTTSPTDSDGGEGVAPASGRGGYAEKVARNKRLILKAIRDCDPRLEGLIEKARFPAKGKGFTPPVVTDTPKPRARDMFFKTCYAVALLAALLLIYLVLLQNV